MMSALMPEKNAYSAPFLPPYRMPASGVNAG